MYFKETKQFLYIMYFLKNAYSCLRTIRDFDQQLSATSWVMIKFYQNCKGVFGNNTIYHNF